MTVATETLQFIDLAAQQRALGGPIRAAVEAVLAHGRYIHGPEVAQLETELAEFCGAAHAVGCGNGTDALVLAARCLGLQPGQAVICPSFTFCATAEAVALLGGIPVFADVDADTFNATPASVEAAIAVARDGDLHVVGIIGADMFGLSADYVALREIADRESLWLIADAAQSFGGEFAGHRVGTFGDITTTSFFPAKPLGCYGDGGALFTDDPEKDALLRSLRVHGSGTHKYDNVHIGTTSRLDTIQAAILRVKLEAFPDELQARQHVAARYADGLRGIVTVPSIPEGAFSSWAQYVVILPEGTDRDAIQESLKADGVPTAVYYGKPLHIQTAYRHYPATDLSVTDMLTPRVLALPMHPYLGEESQERVIGSLRAALA